MTMGHGCGHGHPQEGRHPSSGSTGMAMSMAMSMSMWREFCVNVKVSYSCTDSVSTGLRNYGLSKLLVARVSTSRVRIK